MSKVLLDKAGARYILIAMICAKLFTSQPRMIALKAESASWLVVGLAGLGALAGYAVLYALLQRFPGGSLVTISHKVLGRAFGALISLGYCFWFLFAASLLLRQVAAGFRVAVLPQTPLPVIQGLFLIAVLIVAYKGFETLCRMAAYLFPALILLYLITLAGTARLLEFHWLFPVFGPGVLETLVMVLPESSLYSEVLILGVFAPMLRPADLNSVGLWGLAWGWIVLTLSQIILAAVFPHPSLSRLVFPMLDLTRMIEISEFLQRLESLFVFLWVFVVLFKVIAVVLAAAEIFAQTARLPDFRLLLPAIGLLAFAIGSIPDNIVQSSALDSYTLRTWSWPLSYALPGLTLAVAALRGLGGETDANAQAAQG